MEPIINEQQSANTTLPTRPEQTTINSHFSFCLHKPRGAVHPEYLAHLVRYSEERVESCRKTLAALARVSQPSARQGVFGPGQQAPEIAALEEYCENNKKLWEKLQGLVEA
ncbi:hypothetical protein LY76DRAFT_525950 [Colletotrichum caudatum]|nr:hypothetical protein LY76DRAFT_525950 [Colletotrichum caudatum]